MVCGKLPQLFAAFSAANAAAIKRSPLRNCTECAANSKCQTMILQGWQKHAQGIETYLYVCIYKSQPKAEPKLFHANEVRLGGVGVRG